MTPARRVVGYHGSSARLHAAAVGLAARASRPLGHRGVQRFSWWLSRYLDDANSATLRLGRSSLQIQLADGYWTPLLDPLFHYEPEVERLLSRALSADTLFVDCGANIGYWSVLGQRSSRCVIAVEAAPLTYERLEANARRNGGDIVCVNAAVWHTAGGTLQIASHPLAHAAASVVDLEGATQRGSLTTDVASVTIDGLVARHDPSHGGPVVLKLDVEGAEIPAIEGAASTIARRDTLLVYEDHGRDATAAVSHYLLDLGFLLFAPDSGGKYQEGACRPVGLDDIRAAKTNPHRGYNYAACRPDSAFVSVLSGRTGASSGHLL